MAKHNWSIDCGNHDCSTCKHNNVYHGIAPCNECLEENQVCNYEPKQENKHTWGYKCVDHSCHTCIYNEKSVSEYPCFKCAKIQHILLKDTKNYNYCYYLCCEVKK